jgi:hypothetical protein
MTHTIKIRASSLPSYNDCARRTVVYMLGEIVTSAGFTLNQTKNHIGTSIGTAVHKSTSHSLMQKKEQETININDSIEQGMIALHDELKNELEFDNTTPNPKTGEKQVKEITELYNKIILPKVNPDIIEVPLSHIVENGYNYEIVGHPDLRTEEGTLHDTKTGRKAGVYHAQLGMYAKLDAVNKGKTKGIIVDWIPRTPKDKPLFAPVSIKYHLPTCVSLATHTFKRIKKEVNDFLKSGNPDSFPANPMSQLCSKKYCPAHGTKWCRLV